MTPNPHRELEGLIARLRIISSSRTGIYGPERNDIAQAADALEALASSVPKGGDERSLGERLFDCVQAELPRSGHLGPLLWSDYDDAGKGVYERAAKAFAVALSHYDATRKETEA